MRKIVLIALFCVGIQFSGFSQSLEEYLRLAADNNPELKAYFNDYKAALERVPQAGALPDPELNMGFFLKPMEFPMGNQWAQFELMQMFPWFGTLGARKEETSKMALSSFEVFQDAQNRLFFQVKSIWYRLFKLEEEIRIVQENLDILNQYERLALVSFQGGSSGSGMSDVLRVRMEIKEVENSLALLLDSRFPLQAEFNLLLNRNVNDIVTIPDALDASPLNFERLALLDSITQNNPMLKMLDAEAEAYEAQKRMAKLEGRPMLGAGVTYMAFSARTENGMSMGGEDMVMPMVSLSIPIYRKKYSALQKEAAFKQIAVQQRREYTVNQLSVEWASAIRTLDDAQRRVRLYTEQIDLARQTLNLLMVSYSTEGRALETVLGVQQQLLDYQLKRVTAVVDQYTTLAVLENMAAANLN